MSTKSGGRPKHGRKSTGSDDGQPVSPDKVRGTKRRKTAHVEDVRVIGLFNSLFMEHKC
jgi:hypothetical protein